MSDLELALRGWRMTTAKIYYRCPDAPTVVNPHWFLWQNIDSIPQLPRLNTYLRWWNDTLDGKLHSVQIAVSGLLGFTELKQIGKEYRL